MTVATTVLKAKTLKFLSIKLDKIQKMYRLSTKSVTRNIYDELVVIDEKRGEGDTIITR